MYNAAGFRLINRPPGDWLLKAVKVAQRTQLAAEVGKRKELGKKPKRK